MARKVLRSMREVREHFGLDAECLECAGATRDWWDRRQYCAFCGRAIPIRAARAGNPNTEGEDGTD